MGRELEIAERSAQRPEADTCRLRAFPNEDVYFHIKRFDNARVVREHDPQTGGNCWKSFGLASGVAVLLIGALLPHAYSLLAGYQIQTLKQEQDHLLNERSTLELEMAGLLSPDRLEKMAVSQDFVTPASQNVIYLEPKSEGSLALNTKR